MRDIVREVIPDGRQAPYGLIVAAACDVSAETISACREEALARGVTEAHLWTKAHLEDMLFQPDNDHLLFVYFGVSLGVRRRSQVQRLRGFIALKRKLLRALALDSVQMTTHKDVLVRDIEDSAYPEEADVPGFSDISCSSWDFGAVLEFSTGGILVSRLTYDGWIKAEGDAWDVLEDSRSKPGTMYADYCEALKGEMPRRAASSEAWRQVPR